MRDTEGGSGSPVISGSWRCGWEDIPGALSQVGAHNHCPPVIEHAVLMWPGDQLSVALFTGISYAPSHLLIVSLCLLALPPHPYQYQPYLL